jgi:hypothetical protein
MTPPPARCAAISSQSSSSSTQFAWYHSHASPLMSAPMEMA